VLHSSDLQGYTYKLTKNKLKMLYRIIWHCYTIPTLENALVTLTQALSGAGRAFEIACKN
jgi:hypothetical protein